MDFVNLLQEFAFNLAVILLPVLASFAVAALTALTKKWLAEIERNKPELWFYLDTAVEMAVRAVEQMELNDLVSDKKQEAFNIAQAYLNEHGWDEIDVAVLEAAIEAEVMKQFPN